MWKQVPPLAVFLVVFTLLGPLGGMVAFVALLGLVEPGQAMQFTPQPGLLFFLVLGAFLFGGLPAALTGGMAWGRWRNEPPRWRYLAEILAAGGVLGTLPLLLAAIFEMQPGLLIAAPFFGVAGVVGALPPTLLLFPAEKR